MTRLAMLIAMLLPALAHAESPRSWQSFDLTFGIEGGGALKSELDGAPQSLQTHFAPGPGLMLSLGGVLAWKSAATPLHGFHAGVGLGLQSLSWPAYDVVYSTMTPSTRSVFIDRHLAHTGNGGRVALQLGGVLGFAHMLLFCDYEATMTIGDEALALFPDSNTWPTQIYPLGMAIRAEPDWTFAPGARLFLQARVALAWHQDMVGTQERFTLALLWLGIGLDYRPSLPRVDETR